MMLHDKKKSAVIDLLSVAASTLKEQSPVMVEFEDRLLSFEEAMRMEDPHQRALFFDKILHANLGKMTTGLSPAALFVAFTDWYCQWLLSPNQRLMILQLYIQQLQRMLEKSITHHIEGADTKPIRDKRFHKRFKEAVWSTWPYRLFAELFLNCETLWKESTKLRGLDSNHKELVSFVGFQWLNAMSPENNPFLNPNIMQKTWEEKGRNILEGWVRWQNDCWRYITHQGPVKSSQFKVGKQVAITKGKIVYRNELFELIQYAPQTKKVYKEPVLIVPAWIMKYYILDLSPHNSLVNYMVKKGHTVFMMSWKNPDSSYRNYGMRDYLKRGLFKAIEAAQEITGERAIHATGYCIGGTLLSMGAAYFAARHKEFLKTVTLFAAQIDFKERSELMTFIDENQLSYLEDIMFSQGYLRGDQMSATFEVLRPKELIWYKAIQRYFLDEQTPMTDLTAWNQDTTRLPYQMHSEYLRHFHLNNDLVEGEYHIDGKPLILEDIRLPMFVVAAEKDHIAPWKSVYKIHLYAKQSDITFVLTNKGHNGGIVSEPRHEGRRYKIGKSSGRSNYELPNVWYYAHKSSVGSWWGPWHRWLASHSTEKIVPPPLGSKKNPIIGDAPGTYVKG